MAKRNGGIIGPSNVPTGQYGGVAPGVWRLRDAFNYIKAGLWPVAGTYPVGNSLRFNSGSSDYLSRTPATATNRKTWTWSGWVKRSNLGSWDELFSATLTTNNTSWVELRFDETTDTLTLSWYSAGILTTSQVFRDPSAWYHIVLAVDTTQATASNRANIYINGSLVTAYSTDNRSTQITQNQDTGVNSVTSHTIGNKASNNTWHLDGYLSEVNFIDGQALTASSFGLTDSSTGIWIPKPYSGTYGTNGFYLKFANSAALGTDSSGNGNTFTVNNLTSVDQSTDTPTNNFNTLNPLIPLGSNFSAPTEGNLSLSQSGIGNSGFYASTIIPSAGKWYFEVKAAVISTSDRSYIGIANFESVTGTSSIESGDYKGISVSTGTYGRIAVTNGATTTEFDVAGYAPTTNDIMIFAVDMDNSRVYIGKNGTWFTTTAASGGNPATSTGYFSPVLGNGFAVGATHGAGTSVSATHQYNFGSPMYAANSYTDANGFGNFSYAVPSGYYSLCSKNLAVYG